MNVRAASNTATARVAPGATSSSTQLSLRPSSVVRTVAAVSSPANVGTCATSIHVTAEGRRGIVSTTPSDALGYTPASHRTDVPTAVNGFSGYSRRASAGSICSMSDAKAASLRPVR